MKRRSVYAVVFLAAIVGSLAAISGGCGDSTSPTIAGGGHVPTSSDIEYLDPQPVDLEDITNLEQAYLTEEEEQVLARQSFVAVGYAPQGAPWKFWQVYEGARYEGLPVFITTDSLLNAYHSLFDTLLQRMEEAALYDQAVAMTDALYGAAYDQWDTATDPDVRADARLNRAYFAVGAALLDPDASIPSDLRSEVEAELALIEDAAGPDLSPILGCTEYYDQYKPRGHYTRSERLEQYFKAMMWYGHTAFYLNPVGDVTPDLADSLIRRAILISASLVGPAKESWLAIYEPTSFLVGEADDLTVDDMEEAVADAFGTARPDADELADSTKVAAVRQALNQLPAPLIQSVLEPTPVEGSGQTGTREEQQRSFRVMGQRYIPDSYAFQQLVWDHVGTVDNKRSLPMGLDAMAVLGSEEAYALAVDLYGQDQYQNWDSQIDKVKEEFTKADSTLWPSNLYTGWLDSLREVMTMPDDRSPAFMQTQTWARKSLNAALGSWTELRHDTILYAKQSMAAEGEGGEEPVSAGYVEPYPDFYNEIADLAQAMKDGLDEYDLLDADSTDKLDTMISIAKTLAAISSKELAGSDLTQDDIDFIETYGWQLESLEQFGTTDEGLELSPGAERCPVVADVHTDGISSPPQALEEATGYPLQLYVAFEWDGALQIFVGASYAYYEFTTGIDQRLTDDEWIARLDAGRAPARPVWTDEWIVQR